MARVARVSIGEIRGKADMRHRAIRTALRPSQYTPAQTEAARAQLDPLYGIVIVEDDPTAPDAAYFADLWSDVPATVQNTGERADTDSKHTSRCRDCGKWYAGQSQLARHRAKAHGSPVATSASRCDYWGGLRSSARCLLVAGHPGVHNPTLTGTGRPVDPSDPRLPARATDSATVMDGIDGRWTDTTLGPCPRCGRTDWQTQKGREWHLENYPTCAGAPRKPEHTYVQIGA